jgi:hypothetical protein
MGVKRGEKRKEKKEGGRNGHRWAKNGYNLLCASSFNGNKGNSSIEIN